MPPKPWKTLSSRLVYENPWTRVREDVAALPNGKTTIPALWVMVVAIALILPIVLST